MNVPRGCAIGQPLSQRERQCWEMLAHGMSNKEIAAKLFLSLGTVKNYVGWAYEKLGVRNRVAATRKFYDLKDGA